MKPLITIVTVVLNSKKELEKTMKSVLEQTYENIEYIVIDGGSTDGTIEVIKTYRDKVTRWLSQKDNGPYDAMNKGIDLAQGEWINFMNAGDWFYKPEVIEEIFSDYPSDVDFIYGHHYYRISPTQSLLRNAEDFNTIWEKMMRAEFSIPWLQSIPCHQTIFCRTEIMKKRKFDLGFKLAADFDFLFESYYNDYIFFNSRKIIAVYSKGGITSSRNLKLLREQWKYTKKYQKSFQTDFFFIGLILYVYMAKKKISSGIAKKFRKFLYSI